MNLDRELVRWEDELQKQGKVCFVLKFFAAPPNCHFFPGLAQRLPRERSSGYMAIHTGQPSLADQRGEIVHLGKERGERLRSPQPLGEDRFHTKRFRACWPASHALGRGFDAGEEAFEAAEAFVDALDGCGVGEAQITRRAETLARD